MQAPVSEPMVPVPWRVTRRQRDTADTVTLGLTPVEPVRPASFDPGQFNMLYAFGVGEVPISISGDPGRPGGLRHTTRVVGAVTQAIARLRRGDVLGVRGPFGTAWPTDEAEGHDVVLVAGGIGLAPLRPVIHRLLARRRRYGRVVLAYGTRTPGDVLFRKDLERWQAREDIEVLVTVDRAVGAWSGRVGVVPSVLRGATFDAARAVAMVCGPEVMMRFTAHELQRLGLAPERIFVSLERNMRCAVGFCGHCQLGPEFVCRDGPVFPYPRIARLILEPEV